MLGVFKSRRRAALRAQPVRREWIQTITQNVSFFPKLTPADQAELLGHAQVFLAEKRFEGCAGLEVTEEMRLTIAVQACLLLLHRKTDYFPLLITILVYPSTYFVHVNEPLQGAVWQEGPSARSGETGSHLRSMVLTWDAARYGAADPSDGKNVVFHEFAHQLDYENGVADGAPVLATRAQQRSWAEVMHTEFASLRAADETGIPTLLDTYGATNPAEFFAVATEAFFEQPYALRAQHPRLYAEFQRYYRQDPVTFSAERQALS